MASTFTVPLMPAGNPSQHVRSPSHTRSHQQSSQRLLRPFSLHRIPSERLDPRSASYDQNVGKHSGGQEPSERGIMKRASTAANAPISAPSLNSNRESNGLSRRAEVATARPAGGCTCNTQNSPYPRLDGDSGFSVAKMGSEYRSPTYLQQFLAGVILPLPFLLLSYLSARHAESSLGHGRALSGDVSTSNYLQGLLTTLILTSMTLLFLGAYGRYRRQGLASSRSKSSFGVAGDTVESPNMKFDSSTVARIAGKPIGIALPLVATMQLGPLSVSVILLVMVSSGLLPKNKEYFDLRNRKGWKRLLTQKPWTLGYSSLLCLAAFQFASSSWLSSVTGTLAVIVFAMFCNPPYLVEGVARRFARSPPLSAGPSSALSSTPWNTAEASFALPLREMSSHLIVSAEETSITLISGALIAAVACLLYLACGLSVVNSEFVADIAIVALFTTFSLAWCEVSMFQGRKIALATGLAAAIIGNALILSNFQELWEDAVLAGMAYMAVQLDMAKPVAPSLPHTCSLPSEEHDGLRNRNLSAPTNILLQSTKSYSLLHGILADKDSRRIFYFMLLNLSFMLVQSTYGILTGSLGLISDSIHMFFDCFALLVGLCAAVMSKWPPSIKYPYGYGKMDTLAGFGNGIFLMLISIEIVWEAIERLMEGSDVSRTMELLIVSLLGLLVNLIGIMAFEHGHGHGGHSHSHASDAHHHAAHSTSASSIVGHEHKHHQHGGDNMYGIYLHIMADALGSVAVVISTLLVRYFGWSGFDPLASCAIAILIFASAVPLVFSSGKKLLLSLPGDVEYTIRDILAGVSTIHGVVGYAVPKFWLDDIGKKDAEHEHHHHHPAHQHQPNSHDHHDVTHPQAFEHSHTHHDHDLTGDHSHHSECENPAQVILGVIHVIASKHASLDDVRARVSDYLRSKNMDIIVQVERENDAKCWCGGGQRPT